MDVTDAAEAVRAFLVPAASALTIEQRVGNACIWCPTVILPGQGVSLGDADGCYPHACPPCHELQGAALAAYLDWDHHVTDCTLCRTGPCETTLTMKHEAMRARERAGWGAAYCGRCQRAFGPGETFMPHVWLGTSRVVLSLVHTGPCAVTDPGETGAQPFRTPGWRIQRTSLSRGV
ncbi:hypothetical protein [Streptomyces alboflavus]|uniref:hypothetical protein n=1 Tax=Streptomyces alboflavus TaxID=67267 RepID=UPI0004C25462|nr:hypothetical protein [Streptomyces alboflavus]